jgi:hypothetical protein
VPWRSVSNGVEERLDPLCELLFHSYGRSRSDKGPLAPSAIPTFLEPNLYGSRRR